MTDLTKVPLPPGLDPAMRAWMQLWQRDVLAQMDVRWAELQLGANIGIEGRDGSELPTILEKITDAGVAQDQRFMPLVNAGGALSTQNIAPLTATADATTATITVAAHTVQYGFGLVSYTGGTISGLTPNTEYFVYADDSTYAGGAASYTATTSRTTTTANSGRYLVGKITTAISANTANISAATSANPISFTTSAAHGWTSGDSVTFAALPGDFGTNLNGTTHVITVTGATSFTIAVNGSGYAAYTTGGTATRVSDPTDGGFGGGGGWIGLIP